MRLFFCFAIVFTAQLSQAQKLSKQLDKAKDYIISDDLSRAVTVLDKVIKKDAGVGDAYYLRAMAQELRGNDKKAVEDIHEAIKLSPKQATFHALRGKIWLKLEQPEKAFKAFDDALQLNNQQPEALLYRADYYLEQKDYVKALSDYERLSEIISGDDGLFYRLAHCNQALGNYVGAIDYYQQALAINGNDLESRWNLSLCYFAKERYDESIAQLNRLIIFEPKNAEFRYQRGLCYEQKMDFSEAAKSYEQAVEIDKKNVEYRQGIIRLADKQKQFKTALYQTELALTQAGAHYNLYINKALLAMKIGNFGKAQKSLGQALISLKNPQEQPELYLYLSLYNRLSPKKHIAVDYKKCDSVQLIIRQLDIASSRRNCEGQMELDPLQKQFIEALQIVENSGNTEGLIPLVNFTYYHRPLYHVSEVLLEHQKRKE